MKEKQRREIIRRKKGIWNEALKGREENHVTMKKETQCKLAR
jgi:hypothetical protein